eukprot:19791-Eustigmatos_ZCMA.PRE.1
MPRPRYSGSTNRSSRYRPGLQRKVEKLWKNSTKPTARPSTSASTASQYGRGPNSIVASASGV